MDFNISLDPEGTAYLDPATGDLYRLRDYRADRHAEPFACEHTIPTYTVHRIDGVSSTAASLPDGAVVVWRPAAARKTQH